MKKVLSYLIAMLVLFTTALSGSSLAAKSDEFSQEEVKLIEKTNKLFKSKKTTPQELESYGWEIVSSEIQEDSTTFQTYSTSGGSARVFNYFYKSSQYPGLYLAQSWWEYDNTWIEYEWESTAGNAYDLFVMSISNNGEPLSTNAQKGGVTAYDAEGVAFPGIAWIDNYNRSGLEVVIDDRGGSQGLGSSGSAWFYIAKPTEVSGEYSLNGRWTHNWSESSVSLTDFSLVFPTTINATWSSTSGLEHWNVEGSPRIFYTW